MGAALGGVVAPVGAAVGKGYSALVDALRNPYQGGISRTAGNIVSEGLKASMPGEVDANLAKLGPEGMLADASDPLQGKASGAVSNSLDARAQMVAALQAREAGTAGRLNASATDNFGQLEPARMATARVLADRAALDKSHYGPALDQGAPPVDAQPVIDLIDDHLKTAVGEQKKALKNLRAEIMEPNPDLPENMPVSAAPPMPGKPQTLVDFLKNAGGVRDDGGDLSSLGLNRFPGLVTEKGLAPDAAREMAHEAGYLGDGSSDSINETYIHDLIDKLQSHPTYSAHDSDMLEAWNAANDARTDPYGNRMTAAQYRARFTGPSEAEAALPSHVPTTNARKLHGVKVELDNVIEHDQPGLGVQPGALKSQNRSLTMARGAINDALEAQVPGYARANAISAPLARKAEAIEFGTKLLNTGPEGLFPDEVAARLRVFDANGPEERVGARIGLRSDIGRRFGQKANPLTPGKAIAGGLESFNPANIGHVFDPASADNFVGAVGKERMMALTHDRLLKNSFTEPRQAAAAAMSPDKVGTAALIKGLIASPIKAATSPLIKAVLPDTTAAYPEVARILSAQGSQRDAYLRALRNRSATSQANAVKGQSFGNRAALAAALLANGALHSGPKASPRRARQGN